jgi:hypothetical protein
VNTVFPPRDQNFYLDVLRRAYPQEYLVPIELKKNGGFELFRAAALLGARLSLAVSRVHECSFLSTAGGGTLATGSVEFYRGSFAAGAITLTAGTVVSTPDGRRFRTTSSAVFGATELGPKTATVSAVAVGYSYNVPGRVTTAGGEVLEGQIREIVTLMTSVPAIDPAMMVRQITATTGGAAACLDGLGNDVEIPRHPDESDDAYRVRIRETPDAVSPGAVQRGVDKLLAAVNSAGCLREVGTGKLPGIFYDAGTSLDSPQVPARNFAYDMDGTVRPEDRFKLYLSVADFRGFFLVGVPRVVVSQFGLVYDGTSADAHPMQNAYDTTALNAVNADYDGVTQQASALYKSVYSLIQDKKAGGVGFSLYVEDVGCF